MYVVCTLHSANNENTGHTDKLFEMYKFLDTQGTHVIHCGIMVYMHIVWKCDMLVLNSSVHV